VNNLRINKVKKVFDFHNEFSMGAKRCTGQYSHIVEDMLYYQIHHAGVPGSQVSSLSIALARYKNGSYDRINNAILKDTLACTNFRVFVDTNPSCDSSEKYKAIGGFHSGRSHPMVRNCSVSQQMEEVEVYDPVWPDTKRYLFRDDKAHNPKYANGLYTFTSKDGVEWSSNNRPIISTFSSSSNVPEGLIGFDCMPSCFFDNRINKYVLYFRSNIKLGCRHVLRSESRDFITWTTPEYIKIDPSFDFEHDNLYYMGAYQLSDGSYVAFPSTYKVYVKSLRPQVEDHREAITKVLRSNDGISWTHIGNVLYDGDLCDTSKGHMQSPHILSFIEEKDSYVFLVQEGYFIKKNCLYEYRIDKDEFWKAI
jgi:hypothetical protein